MASIAQQKQKILIVDDEPAIRNLLTEMLRENYVCTTSESAEAALSEFQKETFDLVISDINLGGMTGVEMVPRILAVSPDTVVMMISGVQSVDTAIEAMRVGAFDYIRKPFEYDHVMVAVRRALSHHDLLASKRRYENELETLVEQRTAQLHHLAYHDTLTDLPNEILFEDRLGQVLVGSSGNQQTAVLLICIDNLRTVRDTIGHPAANQILLEVSHRLHDCLGEDSTIARFDGDIFPLLLSHTNPELVVETTSAIFESLKPTFLVDDREIYAQVNIGISVFPEDGIDGHTLLRNAGAALSLASKQGAGGYQFYTADMNAKAVERLAMENNLRRALERNELSVFYQPKIDVRTRRILGMEALLRWNSPEEGSVSPQNFIPLAESTGLIIPIGEWVLKTACFQTRAWHNEGFPLHLSVNLSRLQFQDKTLLQKISTVIEDSGMDPRFLNLEVTESSIMTNADSAVQILSQLRKTGISISIDDFGTGYSSLGYLKKLPIDVLKIDKSFINNVTTDADDAAIVMTIITLAHNLRLRVVAEGVETEDQLQLLNLLRCDEWQGFLHSRPLSLTDFDQMLRTKFEADELP